MKQKRTLLTVLLFLSIFIFGIFNSVNAAQASPGRNLNIKFLRKLGYGYELANTQKVVWKIYDVENDNWETIYCLKGGPGFGSAFDSTSTSPGTQRQESFNYNQYFDLKDPEQIPSTYKNALPTEETNYASLMWILDNIYVPAEKNASAEEQNRAAENKQILLEAAEKYAEDQNLGEISGGEFSYLTDDDIDAVQQLAIWYFTNSDNDYHITNKTFEFYLNSVQNEEGSERKPLSDENCFGRNGWDRANACVALFKYLVTTGEQNSDYEYKTVKQTNPIQLANTTIIAEKKNNRLILGPYKIEELRNDVAYSLEAEVSTQNGNKVTDVEYLQDDKITNVDNIKELVGKNFYISIPENTDTKNIKLKIISSLFKTNAEYWSVVNQDPSRDQPVVIVEKEKISFETEKTYTEKVFDLALRKFIIKIGDKEVKTGDEYIREPKISNEEKEALENGETTTAEKVHTKDALSVKTGDIVLYKIRVYNEGEVAGYASEVTDYLPAGLKFLENSEINRQYGWTSEDGKTVKTNYLDGKLLEAYNGETLDYEDLLIECEVVATVGSQDQKLRNIAEITEDKDKDGNPVEDRDSIPNDVNKDNYQPMDQKENDGDDNDYEDLVLKGEYFDLSLRKFIASVNNGKEEKKYDRAPKVNVESLASGDSTTATYEHSKEPVSVSNGDIVTYTIRVYNEGQINGYVTEIKDHIPEQLEFLVNDDLNAKYGWEVSTDGRTVTTDITSPNTKNSANRDEIYKDRAEGEDKVLLKAFNGTELDYIDVQIRCKVKDNIDLYEKITNIAEITKATDEEGKPVEDRDSTEDSLTKDNSKPEDKVPNDNLPKDEDLPEYKDPEIEKGDKYIPGQQDDDDFEKLVLKRFDLALRKFITAVDDKQITNRVPVFNKLSDTEYEYVHPKDPVEVANGNIVTYTLRIFNEGNTSGYAKKVKDDLPEGLEYLPDNEINKEYRWKMYTAEGVETTDVNEAKYIETDYLSKEQETEEGANLLKAFNPETMTMPDYKDVKIAFRVTEPNTSDRIITNIAEITEDTDEKGNPVEDVDSEPNNDKENEDDRDKEHIKVKYFDLSLKKWVSESIVTYNGKTTVNKTGHTGEENPEPPAKVEIKANQLSKTTVKFKFVIKVTNEGEIAGYAKEIIDYIPEGLTFNKADNPKWREEDGKVLTDQLKDTLLEPGESATVEIILTWKNSKDNLGQKTNWAEIYKDENEYNSPDIDSTPGNDKPGEDDIDDAPVILTIKTGNTPTYIVLGLASVAMLSSGVILIKKFVI